MEYRLIIISKNGPEVQATLIGSYDRVFGGDSGRQLVPRKVKWACLCIINSIDVSVHTIAKYTTAGLITHVSTSHIITYVSKVFALYLMYIQHVFIFILASYVGLCPIRFIE